MSSDMTFIMCWPCNVTVHKIIFYIKLDGSRILAEDSCFSSACILNKMLNERYMCIAASMLYVQVISLKFNKMLQEKWTTHISLKSYCISQGEWGMMGGGWFPCHDFGYGLAAGVPGPQPIHLHVLRKVKKQNHSYTNHSGKKYCTRSYLNMYNLLLYM